MNGTVIVKLTSATVIDGQIVRAGTKVEMVEYEAKQLLKLGKAVVDSVPTDKADKVDSSVNKAAAKAAADAAKAAKVKAAQDAAKAAEATAAAAEAAANQASSAA
jgi:hypothetical protein